MARAPKAEAQAASTTQFVPPRFRRLAIRPATTLGRMPAKESSDHSGSRSDTLAGSSPLKRGKAGSDERRGATPTKLAKSPARRRVLSDLYGRLTVATEREPFEGAPSGETEATGEGETEEVGSQRAAARAPLRVACRPPRRSEDGPKIIQLLTPVSAARLAEDFAGLPSTLSVPW